MSGLNVPLALSLLGVAHRGHNAVVVGSRGEVRQGVGMNVLIARGDAWSRCGRDLVEAA